MGQGNTAFQSCVYPGHIAEWTINLTLTLISYHDSLIQYSVEQPANLQHYLLFITSETQSNANMLDLQLN